MQRNERRGIELSIFTKRKATIKTTAARIKHLKGTFDVDSTLSKGTSILINVPV